MIKVLAAARRHPSHRSPEGFRRYWAQTHGPMFANTPGLIRYVQHITLAEAYAGEPAPTYDGASIFTYERFDGRRPAVSDPEVAELLRATLGFTVPADDPEGDERPYERRLARAVALDDAHLFDRSSGWPAHERRAYVVARERVVLDGPTSPEMVKSIHIAAKLPGLALGEFFERWEHVHGALVARVPGLRRYVQHHGVAAGYEIGGQSHDGWSELWFDDLAGLRRAYRSPAWRAVVEHGAELFARPRGVVVAREVVQKDERWTYDDWGIDGLDDAQIRERLRAQGYGPLADDPRTPERLRTAASRRALAVWTDEHLVTIDESAIDARPSPG